MQMLFRLGVVSSGSWCFLWASRLTPFGGGRSVSEPGSANKTEYVRGTVVGGLIILSLVVFVFNTWAPLPDLPTSEDLLVRSQVS